MHRGLYAEDLGEGFTEFAFVADVFVMDYREWDALSITNRNALCISPSSTFVWGTY
jgi:hypothetical protein